MSLPRGRDAWIPWTFAAGFGVFLLGTIALSVIAVRSDPGLVAGAPQRLAGSHILPVGPAPVLELRVQGRLVEARLRGPDGEPMAAEAISGMLRRATHAREDQPVAFEPAGDGSWRAAVAPPSGGIWEIAVQARGAGATVHASLRL